MKSINLMLIFLATIVCSKRQDHIMTLEQNKDVKAKNYKIATPDTILLVLINFQEKQILNTIADKMYSFYHTPVKIKISYLPKFAYYEPRNRYKADSLIKWIRYLNQGTYKFVVGLTSEDIEASNGPASPHWGVFGLGTLNNDGCVISSFRLRRKATQSLLIERMQKVVLHEIGHNKGLYHCTTPYPCFMKAANGKMSEVDEEPMDICSVCRSKINLSR